MKTQEDGKHKNGTWGSRLALPDMERETKARAMNCLGSLKTT